MSSKAVRQTLRKPTRVRPSIRLEAELAKVRGRIRAVDGFTAGLTLAAATLAYTLAMIGLDHWLHFPEWLRQSLLGLFLVGAGVYLYVRLFRPLFWQVNVYYAARALERSLPHTKNGLVNWLDLRGEPLPPAIRGAVQEQAALELQESDLDEAVPVRRPMRLFFAAAALLFGVFVVSIVLPDQIGSLLKRAFVPFGPTVIPTYTRLQLVQPAGDEELVDDPANAPVKELPVAPEVPVPIGVVVHGTVPSELTLEYQPSLSEKPFTMSMTPPGDEYRRQSWTATIPSNRIPADGLWFRVLGGDGQTRRYRLVVTSNLPPSVADVEAVYHYPAYTRRPDKQQNSAPLKALVGTKVSLSITADQPVKGGFIEFRVEKGKDLPQLPLEPSPTDEKRLVLPQPLELNADFQRQVSYVITMIGKDDRPGSSPPYSIEVEKDQSPNVEILRIGQEELQPNQELVKLPLNANVSVIGKAHDDIAVSQARLRLRTAEGNESKLLGGKPVVGPLQQAIGYAQPAADFELGLDLTKIAAANGKPAELKAGQILEFWVEATDTCPPKPNVGESRHLKIELIEPPKPPPQNPDQQPDQQPNQQQKPNDKQDPNNQPQPNQDQKQKDGGQGQPDQGKNEQKNQNPEKNQEKGKNQDSKPDSEKDKNNPGQPDGAKNEKPAKDESQKNQSQKDKSNGQPEKNSAEKPEPQPDKNKGDKSEEKPQQDKSEKPGEKSEPTNAGKRDGSKSEGADKQPSSDDQKKADDVAKTAERLAEALREREKEKGNPENKPETGKEPTPDAGQDKKPSESPEKKQNGDNDPNASKTPKPEAKPGEKEQAKPEQVGDKKPAMKPDGNQADKKPNDKPDADKQAQTQENKPEAKPGEKPQPGEKPDKQSPDKEPQKKDNDKGPKPDSKDDPPKPMPHEGQPPGKTNQSEQGSKADKNPDGEKSQPKSDPSPKKPEDQAKPMPHEGPPPGNTNPSEKGRPADKKPDGDKPQPKPMPNEGKEQGEKKPGDKADGKPENKDPSKSDAPSDKQGDQSKPMQKDGNQPGDKKPESKPDGAKEPPKPADGKQDGDKNPSDRQGSNKSDSKPEASDKNRPDSKEKPNPEKSKQFNPAGKADWEESPPDKPNEKHAAKPTDLLLETLRDKMNKGEIDKDVLKKMNWTEKELQDFMAQYKKLKDQGRLPTTNEAAAGSGNKTNLKGTGPQQVNTQSGNALDLNDDPASRPPPDLRDSSEEFTKRLSKQKKR